MDGTPQFIVMAFAFPRQGRGQGLVENACEGNFRGLMA